jgi:hypothetical protein
MKPNGKMHKKQKKNVKKSGEKNRLYIWTFYVCTQVFRKMNILCGLCKKTKEYPVNSHIGAWKFVFFTLDTEKMFFLQKTCVPT